MEIITSKEQKGKIIGTEPKEPVGHHQVDQYISVHYGNLGRGGKRRGPRDCLKE